MQDRCRGRTSLKEGRQMTESPREVEALLRAAYRHVVDIDIKGYFDSIDHGPCWSWSVGVSPTGG